VSIIREIEPALLILEDGNAFVGVAIGAKGRTTGELVFATGMTGYQETITDPSYAGQILIQTAPHIGNTGVNVEDDESERIWVNGYVAREFSRIGSSYRADESLYARLERTKVVGIGGVDTRALTRHLRTAGVMKAGIFSGAILKTHRLHKILKTRAVGDQIKCPDALLHEVLQSPNMTGAHLVSAVSTKKPQVVNAQSAPENPLKVVAIDLGIKAMTPKMLAERQVEVHILNAQSTIEQVLALEPDGVFFSNGPGDPESATHEVELLREVLSRRIPFFGICMGNQMLGRALGFQTYKLPFGHRGINQPVKNLKTNRVEITAQNHGFAVDMPLDEEILTPYNEGVFGRARVSHIGLNDNVVEGIECLDIPAFSVQYHPEAAAGPHDAQYLFDAFVELMDNQKAQNDQAQLAKSTPDNIFANFAQKTTTTSEATTDYRTKTSITTEIINNNKKEEKEVVKKIKPQISSEEEKKIREKWAWLYE
jgi:carbamoyl-phosphate synthase small subunit